MINDTARAILPDTYRPLEQPDKEQAVTAVRLRTGATIYKRPDWRSKNKSEFCFDVIVTLADGSESPGVNRNSRKKDAVKKFALLPAKILTGVTATKWGYCMNLFGCQAQYADGSIGTALSVMPS
jgi:hypothetical protein